jgi:YD repeat-containing protein
LSVWGFLLLFLSLFLQVTQVKEPDGNIRKLTYDVEGNVIHAKDADRDVHFSYCGVNKLASRMERWATFRFMYDTEDQLHGVKNYHLEQNKQLLNTLSVRLGYENV